MKRILILCGLVLLSSAALAAEPQPAKTDTEPATESVMVKSLSGLPLPRFASLRSGEVNMRTGPGTRYPIIWVFKRQGLPVEITAEYDIWRRVRDPEGNEGWVHKNEISGKRAVIVTGTAAALHELRDSPTDTADVKAHLETGVTGQLLSCNIEWCKLKFDGIKGYLRKSDFWGAYPYETFD